MKELEQMKILRESMMRIESDDDDREVKCINCGALNDTDDMRGDSSCNTCGEDVFGDGDGDRGMDEGKGSKGKKNKVNKDYDVGDEVEINKEAWFKVLRAEGYDEDDIEYYDGCIDNGDGEGIILDGVIENRGTSDEGMYVDCGGDEFVVPFRFMSDAGGNIYRDADDYMEPEDGEEDDFQPQNSRARAMNGGGGVMR